MSLKTNELSNAYYIRILNIVQIFLQLVFVRLRTAGIHSFDRSISIYYFLVKFQTIEALYNIVLVRKKCKVCVSTGKQINESVL